MEEILDNSAEAAGAERVGFGPRLGAYVLDIVFMGILVTIVIYIFMAIGIGAAANAMESTVTDMDGAESLDEIEARMKASMAGAGGGVFAFIMGALIAVGIASIGYTLIEALTAASPGKMILGLKIGKQDGTAADTGSLFIRWAVKNIQYIFILLTALTGVGIFYTIGNIGALAVFIGCFFVLGANKQAFQDMAAKTAVFKKADIK